MYKHTRKEPTRLLGVGIYNLTDENWNPLTFEDILPNANDLREEKLPSRLAALQNRYHLDFAEHLNELFRGNTLCRTIKYTRKDLAKTHDQSGTKYQSLCPASSLTVMPITRAAS